MSKLKGFNLLEKKIPTGTAYLVEAWLDRDPINIRINKPRNSKLGDFRPAQRGLQARISVNSDLHPVEFLITLAHEFAHAENHRLHGKRVNPHGREWKSVFRNKLNELLGCSFIAETYKEAIIQCYFKRERIASSSCSEIRRLIDSESGVEPVVRLEDIPLGSIFRTGTGRLLKKGKKIRTRYKCRDIKTKRFYTVHPMAEIIDFEAPGL